MRFPLLLIASFSTLATMQATTSDAFSSSLTIRHIDPNGIGYCNGYTTLEGFFAPSHSPTSHLLPFLDVRGHLFNNGQWAANGGLGLRYCAKRIWGINGYYDFREAPHGHYHQAGIGLESLGTIWDVRLNGYFPLGKTKSSFYRTRFEKFSGNYALLSRKQECAMKGFDAEAGTHLHIGKFPLYVGEGFYYLNGPAKSLWGGQARASFYLYDYLCVEATASYDPLFKWLGQVQISLTAPIKRRKAKPSSHLPLTQALQKVTRHEIIPTSTRHSTIKAKDPATGAPLVFIFVDNTSHSNGTFESPYNSLIAAQNASTPGDTIYVFPGDGTSNQMDEGIILKNNQSLLGAATPHQILTKQGAMTIPSYASLLPNITNFSDSVVSVANNNIVSGLCINHPNGDGVSSALFPKIANLTLSHNTIVGPQDTFNAVSLTNMTGHLNLLHNFISAGSGGIAITNNEVQNAIYTLTSNTIYPISHTASFSLIGTDCSNIKILFNDAEMSSRAAPTLYIELHGTSKDNTCQFVDGEMGSYVGCISVNLYDNAALDLSISGNVMASSNQSINLYAQDNAQLSIQLSNNSIKCQNDGGVRTEITDSATASLSISNNKVFSYAEGINIIGHGSGQISTAIANNIIESASNACILHQIYGAAKVNADIQGNQISTYTSGDGIALTNYETGLATALIHNNTIFTAEASDIHLTTYDSAKTFANVTRNIIKGSTSSGGVWIDVYNTGESIVWCTANQYTGNYPYSAHVTVGDGLGGFPSLCLRFQNNHSEPIQYTDGSPPYRFEQTSGIFQLEPLIGNLGTFSIAPTILQESSDICLPGIP